MHIVLIRKKIKDKGDFKMNLTQAKELLLNTDAEVISLISEPGMGKLDLINAVANEMGKEIMIVNMIELSGTMEINEMIQEAFQNENMIIVFDEVARGIWKLDEIIAEIHDAKALIIFADTKEIPFQDHKRIHKKKHINIEITLDLDSYMSWLRNSGISMTEEEFKKTEEQLRNHIN